MFTVDITKFVPNFLLADKNGYAIAMAFQAALQMMNDIISDGVDCVIDYDTMPEWRLDELAWELNCLYDYNADIEVKRDWIKNAIPYYRLYGTPQAITKYIGSYFDSIELEENWVYSGSPYHFRVTVDGEWTPENEAWARKAIDKAKNVRSVLDALAIGSKSFIGMMAEGQVLGRFTYPLTGPSNYAGRWPQENTIGVLDTSARMGAEGDTKGYPFPYPMAGTRPEINTLGVLDTSARIGAEGDAKGYPFPYPATSESLNAGTVPQDNTLGILDNSARAGISADAAGYRFDYPATSEILNAGTIPQDNTIGVLSGNNIQSAQAEDTYATILYKLCGQDEI